MPSPRGSRKNNRLFLVLAGFAAFVVFQSRANAAEVGVRIRFGLNDTAPSPWDGTVTVSPGKVTLISGWRFEQSDHPDGNRGWVASTRSAVNLGRTNAQKGAKAKKKAAAANNMQLADNGVLLTFSDVTDASVISVKTASGSFEFQLRDIPYGKVIERLKGAVEIDRVAATLPLTAEKKTDDDYPSAAAAPDGTTYVAFTSFTPGIDRNERSRTWPKEPDDLKFLATPPGGDQVILRIFKNGITVAEPIAISESGADVYKTALAIDGDGTLWIFWAQNKNYLPYPKNPRSNFEIWGRSWKDGKLSETINFSNNAESDIWPVATTDANGRVWLAWQGARKSIFQIHSRHQTASGWSEPQVVSTQTRNCWAPSICATPERSGRVAVAWDTYEKGDYDVWFRESTNDGSFDSPHAAANSADYEARPAITYDHDGRLWVSWEQSGPTWGKDWGALVQRKGIGLYQSRQIGLSVWDGRSWFEPAQLVVNSLPGAQPRRRQVNQRVPAIEPQGESREAGQEAEARRNMPHNNLARIVSDRDGRIWLFTRSRQNDFRTQIGSVWLTHAAYYDGKAWVGPILVPHTDNLLYNSPAVVAAPNGGIIVAHSSDHRLDRHVMRRGANALGILDGEDPFENDLYFSRLESPGKPPASELVSAKVVSDPTATSSAATVKERAEIERIRGYRTSVENRELRIVRGEFHRHTEISGDGGNDGPLEDMWRYAIDVAAMDWLGCGDHDNGGHREYTWWLTQKTTDAFHLPGTFEPPFTYERSVRYPEGHRNVIFTNRGIRTLPRLPVTERNPVIHAPDTQMLYKYLHLFDGVCASHTSATSMGTDWRDNDSEVEPMVEIYQGARQNYERPGAPRSPSADDAIGGWEPKGFVNLALLKGYKFSFQSSSDHGSTHISYALVYAENNTREAILKAMKQRHTYAATDNIIAEFRTNADGREYLMGDEFMTSSPPEFNVKLVGTDRFAKITLVKDDVEIELAKDTPASVELKWTDPQPTAGKTSYYYVRGEQVDGELVWISPMWVTWKPKQ